MSICPCKNCDKKGCGTYHDKCEEFMKFRAEKEQEYKTRFINGYVKNMKYQAKRKGE